MERMVELKGGVAAEETSGSFGGGIDLGCKAVFFPLSLELYPRVKKDGNRLERVEVDGKCWIDRQ